MNIHNFSSNSFLSGILQRLYRKRLVRNALQPLLSTSVGKKYIFIVGCYNSGTTLLDFLLSAHDEVSNLPTEGVALTGELFGPEDFGWNRMWYKCREKIELSGFEKKPDSERIKRDWGLWFDPEKEFWVEKSIVNSLNIDWFEENFDSPHFIWIVRNGYAAAEGIRRRTLAHGKHPAQYQKGYPIEMCAQQWAECNQVIEQKIKNTKNWMKITYENLTTTPNEILQEIIDWLPVKDKNMDIPSTFMFHDQTKKVSNMNAESIFRLDSEEIESIRMTVGDDLLRYGYPFLEEKI